MGGEKRVEGSEKEGREWKRMVEERKGKEGKRTSEHSPISKFITAPLFLSIYGQSTIDNPAMGFVCFFKRACF